MKQFKIDVLNEMERRAETQREIKIRDCALALGSNHLKYQECAEIMTAFTKKHPTYKMFHDVGARGLNSLFVGGMVSKCEYQDEDEYLDEDGYLKQSSSPCEADDDE